MEDNDVVMTNEKRTTNETSRQKSFQVIDLENNEEDEIVCIAVLNSTSNTSYHDENGPVSSSVPNNRNRPRVIDVEDDIEVINVDCDNDERLNKPLTRSEPRVIDVEDEIDDKFDDISYTLRVDDSPVSNEPHIIDLEENSKDIENQMSVENPDIACIDNLPGNHAVHDCDSQTEETHTTQIVEAMVHEDPNSSTVSNVSEIDDYDARMRQHFQLDLDSSSSKNAGDLTFTSSCFDELNESAGNLSGVGDAMECDSGTDSDIIEINDEDTNDDCIITSTELPSVSKETSSGTKGVFKTVATIDVELHDEKKKRKKITETVDEIFYRMMPSCVPGVLSLCASEPHCLPTNVRPFKFCYFYHVTPHIVVKEIDKNQFFRIKDQMLIAKKVIQPCTCLSHPLNQNASKLTLLTNPQSLFHRSQCYFAQSSRRDRSNRPKRRGPRRLTYQVTFCRVPRKREGKDFKDWADVVIKRRQNSSLASNSDLEDSKIEHQPFVCKSEADSWGDSKENIITSPIILKTGS